MKQFTLAVLLLLTQQAIARPVSAFDSLARAYEASQIPGVILVAKGDSIIYTNAWGYANLETKIKLTPATLFKTESTGKMYTATGIMQLVEAGRLRLDQTVAQLLPSLKIKNAEKITVHHLLTHTSGLQSPWDDPQFNFKKKYTRQQLEKIITSMPTRFDEPGKEMYYSNSGYIILSWIIEKISGQSFDDYLATHIFQPQQMRTIGHLNDTVMPAGQAQPYRFANSNRYTTLLETVGPVANGAGGWIASAYDLYHFMLGLDKNKYISAATLRQMISANGTKRMDSQYRSYAYGLEVYNNDPVKGILYFGHSGGGAGFSIDAILEPASHYIVIYCGNTYSNSRAVSSNFLRLALQKPLAKIKTPDAIRVYDRIDSVGVAEFVKNEKSYFEQAGITPDERLFLVVADAMESVRDFSNMATWADLGARYFPKSTALWMVTGNGFFAIGDHANARKAYKQALVLATAEKNNFFEEEARKKLKLLGD